MCIHSLQGLHKRWNVDKSQVNSGGPNIWMHSMQNLYRNWNADKTQVKNGGPTSGCPHCRTSIGAGMLIKRK